MDIMWVEQIVITSLKIRTKFMIIRNFTSYENDDVCSFDSENGILLLKLFWNNFLMNWPRMSKTFKAKLSKSCAVQHPSRHVGRIKASKNQFLNQKISWETYFFKNTIFCPFCAKSDLGKHTCPQACIQVCDDYH